MEDYSEADSTSDVHPGDVMDSSTDNPVDAESSELKGSSEREASNPRPRKRSRKLAGLSDEEAEIKRMRANEQERIRQRAISEAYSTLAAHLPDMPTLTHKKGCKQSILNTCIEYIQRLRNLIRAHDTCYKAKFGAEFVSYRMTGQSHEPPFYHLTDASQIICGQHNMHQPTAINQSMEMQQPVAPDPVMGMYQPPSTDQITSAPHTNHQLVTTNHVPGLHQPTSVEKINSHISHTPHRIMGQIFNQQRTTVPNFLYPPLSAGLSQQNHFQPFTPNRPQCRFQMNHDQSQTHYPSSTFLPALASSIDFPGHMDSQPVVLPSPLPSTPAEHPRTRMFHSTPMAKIPVDVDNRPAPENFLSTPVSHQSSPKNQPMDYQNTPFGHLNNGQGSSTPNSSTVTPQINLSSGSGEPVDRSNILDTIDYSSGFDSFLDDAVMDSVDFEKEIFLSKPVSHQSISKNQSLHTQNTPLLSSRSGDLVCRRNSPNNTSGYSSSFLDEFIEALDDFENGKFPSAPVSHETGPNNQPMESQNFSLGNLNHKLDSSKPNSSIVSVTPPSDSLSDSGDLIGRSQDLNDTTSYSWGVLG